MSQKTRLNTSTQEREDVLTALRPRAQPSDASRTIDEIRATLFSSVNARGGWGYYARQGSRVEPTCWALLALLESKLDVPEPIVLSARAFLEHAQQPSGLLTDRNQPSPNFAANGLAAVAWAARPELADRRAVARLVTTIVNEKGLQLDMNKVSGQNNRLQAWPWIDGTFSWVEPTAWCLLALKKWPNRSSEADARIKEADELLVDRACRPGGWNYGNADMLGQDLRPYVPTTALGLLAMQNRREEPAVGRGLDFLRANRLKEVSGLALSLASIALDVCGDHYDDLRVALLGHWDRTRFLGNVQTMAVALYTLTADHHENRAFRL